MYKGDVVSKDVNAVVTTIKTKRIIPHPMEIVKTFRGVVIRSSKNGTNTLATDLVALQERITTTRNGSITSVQAVFVPADDLTDPVPATTLTENPM